MLIKPSELKASEILIIPEDIATAMAACRPGTKINEFIVASNYFSDAHSEGWLIIRRISDNKEFMTYYLSEYRSPKWSFIDESTENLDFQGIVFLPTKKRRTRLELSVYTPDLIEESMLIDTHKFKMNELLNYLGEFGASVVVLSDDGEE